ncbi:MAG TPA: hypothetical protein VEP90_04440 [Methylomirabilota bacterium]|nr:hypothetical protein [Methylomirabilota bacterium]
MNKYTEREVREKECRIAEQFFSWIMTWPVSGLSKGDIAPEGFVPIYRGWRNEVDKETGNIPEVPHYLNREVLNACS